jgi:hypothetical protein
MQNGQSDKVIGKAIATPILNLFMISGTQGQLHASFEHPHCMFRYCARSPSLF